MNQQQIIFFRLWIDILRELLPSSLLEEFSGKETEYLWIKEALTEIERRTVASGRFILATNIESYSEVESSEILWNDKNRLLQNRN